MGASRPPRSRHGASGATRRCACMPRRCCSPATSTRPLPCSPRRPRSPPPCPTPIRSLTARPSWPCWRWIVGAGRRRPSTFERALGAIDESRMHDYPTSVLAFAGAARLAVHRGDLERGRTPADAGDASPSVADVRAALSRRARPGATRQGVLGARRPDDAHATCCKRSTTSCTTAPRSAHSSTRSRSFAAPSPRAAMPERPARRRSPRRSCGCSRTCRPTTPSATSPQRLFVSRNTVNSQVSSIYRKLGVSSRDEAVQRATATGLLGG